MSASALAGMLKLYFITNKEMGKWMGVGVGRGGEEVLFYFEIDELSKPSDTGATHDKSG